jgi:hypothetical protein
MPQTNGMRCSSVIWGCETLNHKMTFDDMYLVTDKEQTLIQVSNFEFF